MTLPTREELDKSFAAASAREMVAAEAFYCGQQWDPAVALERHQAGRPCLVFNKLIGIVAAIAAGIESDGAPLTGNERMGLILDVVRKCGDSQRTYNYCRSSMVENALEHPALSLKFAELAEESSPTADGGIVRIVRP